MILSVGGERGGGGAAIRLQERITREISRLEWQRTGAKEKCAFGKWRLYSSSTYKYRLCCSLRRPIEKTGSISDIDGSSTPFRRQSEDCFSTLIDCTRVVVGASCSLFSRVLVFIESVICSCAALFLVVSEQYLFFMICD